MPEQSTQKDDEDTGSAGFGEGVGWLGLALFKIRSGNRGRAPWHSKQYHELGGD